MMFRGNRFRYQINDYHYYNVSPSVKWCRQNLGPEGFKWIAEHYRLYIKSTEDYTLFVLSMNRDEYSISIDLESVVSL